LAKVGEWQRKEGENLWPNLRRVSIKFDKMEGKSLSPSAITWTVLIRGRSIQVRWQSLLLQRQDDA
jgi:hypothetical protein